MKIEKKVALVTGAASGIGQAVARELAIRGAKSVIAVDRSDSVFEAAELINRELAPEVAQPYAGDVTNETFRSQVYDESIARHGVVSVCVPAAGITRDGLAVPIK